MPNRKIHNIPPLSIQFVIQIPAPAVLPGYRFVIQIFNAAVNPEENLYYKKVANPISVIQILNADVSPEGNLYYNLPEDFVFWEYICPTK